MHLRLNELPSSPRLIVTPSSPKTPVRKAKSDWKYEKVLRSQEHLHFIPTLTLGRHTRHAALFAAGLRSGRFLGGFGVGFLTTLGVGVGFLCPTSEVHLDTILQHTPKLGISVEIVQFLLRFLLKQRLLAVYHDFHWLLVATKFLTAKLHSLYVKALGVGNFGNVGVGVEQFNSDSATLVCRSLSEPGFIRHCIPRDSSPPLHNLSS